MDAPGSHSASGELPASLRPSETVSSTSGNVAMRGQMPQDQRAAEQPQTSSSKTSTIQSSEVSDVNPVPKNMHILTLQMIQDVARAVEADGLL